jgi:hypothetical protein
MDPSEGVHSSLILPLTYQYFDVVHRIDYGGTVMRPFFVGILPNFDFGDVKDQTIASLIVKMEELLVRHGVLPSYHTKIVGRKLKTPRAKFSQEDNARINYSDWPGFSKYGALTKAPQLLEFSPVDYSDENWMRGVGILGKATLFLNSSRRILQVFRVGRSVQFSDKTARKIVSLQENSGSLIVQFSGEALDPEVVGFPNRFSVVG